MAERLSKIREKHGIKHHEYLDLNTGEVIGVLSPIDGREIPRYPDETGLRKCYNGRNGEIQNPLQAVHRLQVGSLSYVGDQGRPRISITSTKLLYYPYVLRREHAFTAKRVQKAIAALFQEPAKSPRKNQPHTDQVFSLR